jgi:hypothetical protein
VIIIDATIITDEFLALKEWGKMVELIWVIAVWLVSYFTLPKIMKLYSDALDEKIVNPVQKINFGTINAILFLLLVRWLFSVWGVSLDVTLA